MVWSYVWRNVCRNGLSNVVSNEETRVVWSRQPKNQDRVIVLEVCLNSQIKVGTIYIGSLNWNRKWLDFIHLKKFISFRIHQTYKYITQEMIYFWNLVITFHYSIFYRIQDNRYNNLLKGIDALIQHVSYIIFIMNTISKLSMFMYQ